MSTRQSWLAAVRGQDFPRHLRMIRATLLCLPVTVDGRIVVNDDAIAEATGLPRRTAQWHLHKATNAGWLERVARGGNGLRCRYIVAVPVRNELRTAAIGSAPSASHSGRSGVRNMVAVINKDRANVREHVAVDPDRERRSEHGDTRDGDDLDELRAERRVTRHRHCAALSLRAWVENRTTLELVVA